MEQYMKELEVILWKMLGKMKKESAPPPLQEGDWVKAIKGSLDESILFIKEAGCSENNWKFTVMNLLGEVFYCEQHEFTPHTLTKDDLPDGWELEIISSDSIPVYKTIKHTIDDVMTSIIITSPYKETAISEALKVHLGQRLLKKAGGRDGIKIQTVYKKFR